MTRNVLLWHNALQELLNLSFPSIRGLGMRRTKRAGNWWCRSTKYLAVCLLRMIFETCVPSRRVRKGARRRGSPGPGRRSPRPASSRSRRLDSFPVFKERIHPLFLFLRCYRWRCYCRNIARTLLLKAEIPERFGLLCGASCRGRRRCYGCSRFLPTNALGYLVFSGNRSCARLVHDLHWHDLHPWIHLPLPMTRQWLGRTSGW